MPSSQKSLGALASQFKRSYFRSMEKPYLLLYMLSGSSHDLFAASEPDVMDCHLWGDLPGELLCKVLQMLPAASQLRFRAVCKAWNWLLSSQGFRAASVSLGCDRAFFTHSEKSLLCVFQIKPGHYEWGEQHSSTSPHRSPFCTSQYTVYQVDLSFLPALGIPPRLNCEQVCGRARWKRFVVAKRGLVCIRGCERDMDGGIRRCAMCVLNPLTKECKELPDLDLQPELPWALEMEVDPGPGPGAGFRVYVVCNTEENSFYHFWVVCVYSSVTDCWSITHCQPIPADTHRQNPRFDCVVSNGVLYRYGSGNLLRYSMDEHPFEWHVGAAVPAVNQLDSQFYLVEHYGSVLFVGQVWHSDYQTYALWKLEVGSMVWVQISVLPKEMMDRVGGCHREEEQWKSCKFLDNVMVAGDFVFLVLRVEYSKLRAHLVACNLSQGNWQVFLRNEPSYPFFVDSYGFLEPMPSFHVLCSGT